MLADARVLEVELVVAVFEVGVFAVVLVGVVGGGGVVGDELCHEDNGLVDCLGNVSLAGSLSPRARSTT